MDDFYSAVDSGYPRRERDRCRKSAAEQQVEMLCLKYRR
jgi:hypothetical protein